LPAGPVILCYDGSKEAAEAIRYAAGLLPGARALVVTAWKPVVEETLATPMTPPVDDPVDANEDQRDVAEQYATNGAQLASEVGLEAEPAVVEADGPLWEAIERFAEKIDARLIVCGTRHSGVAAALPVTLASSLVTHATRAVLVVPSAKAVAERLERVREIGRIKSQLTQRVAARASGA
jgi:nucleotide-binding universal stress UspA family protein